MKVNKQELLDALVAVRPGLAKKAVVEQMSRFIFTEVEVVTYNDRICISYPFKTDFQCSIAAEEFFKVISGLTQKSVELLFKNDKLVIKSGKVKASLSAFTAEDELEMLEVLELGSLDKKWRDLPKDFTEGIFLCLFSASKDMSQLNLTCLKIEDDVIISSDDIRVSHYVMKESIGTSFLIPAESVSELVRFKITKFYLGDSWIYFSTDDGVVFCSKVVKGEYLDFTQYFEFENVRLRLPVDLKQAVETVSVLAEGKFDIDKKISISIVDGKIKCRGEKEVGWIEKEIDIKFKREESIYFEINPIFFSEILARTNVMLCGEDKVLFRTDSFTHLISLYLG